MSCISDKLYWISDRAPPRNKPRSYYFNIDNVTFIQELVYEPFCSDFGPLNLGMTYKFCVELDKLIKNPSYSDYKIYHYTSLVPSKRANAAFLMGAFQIIILGRSAQEAWQPFINLPAFVDFRDASYGPCTYRCTILQCLRGLEKGIKLRWFDYRTFNVHDYEYYEKVENGDWNWIIPNKLLAFSSPAPAARDAEGFRAWTPEDYGPLFKQLGVTAVVRLNQKTYDSERFTRQGIRHYDLYFIDGSCPSESLVKEFLKIAEREPGAVAIHCKAGLGRTGTLIGCYAMKHFGFPGADFIGWIRICRPGSVLGPQQQYLVEMEGKCKVWGTQGSVKDVSDDGYHDKEEAKTPNSPMSPDDVYIAKYGDVGQAERLMSSKKSNQSSPNSPITPASPPRAVKIADVNLRSSNRPGSTPPNKFKTIDQQNRGSSVTNRNSPAAVQRRKSPLIR